MICNSRQADTYLALKRLVSTVRFCPSAPLPLQKPTKIPLLSFHSNTTVSAYSVYFADWLSKWLA